MKRDSYYRRYYQLHSKFVQQFRRRNVWSGGQGDTSFRTGVKFLGFVQRMDKRYRNRLGSYNMRNWLFNHPINTIVWPSELKCCKVDAVCPLSKVNIYISHPGPYTHSWSRKQLYITSRGGKITVTSPDSVPGTSYQNWHLSRFRQSLLIPSSSHWESFSLR
jgi:hypothetical protein